MGEREDHNIQSVELTTIFFFGNLNFFFFGPYRSLKRYIPLKRF